MPSLARKKYFVYTLALDKRNHHVFYVGKGSGQRPHKHGDEAVRDVYSLKCGVIRYLFDHKWTYWIRVVQETDDEDEAYWLEKKVLTSYPYQSLTNAHGGFKTPRLIPETTNHFGAWRCTLTDEATGAVVTDFLERHTDHVTPRLIYAYDCLVVPLYFRHICYQFLEYSQF